MSRVRREPADPGIGDPETPLTEQLRRRLNNDLSWMNPNPPEGDDNLRNLLSPEQRAALLLHGAINDHTGLPITLEDAARLERCAIGTMGTRRASGARIAATHYARRNEGTHA